MSSLERLRAEHAARVRRFEEDNRGFFAASISDRGDDYFEQFDERFEELLADQEAGGGAYFVVVDDQGSVLGRFNLIFGEAGRAELGYRVAERAAGRGVATAAVQEVCAIAASTYGVRRVLAAASRANVASQRVLVKAGFVVAGPADPAEIGGKEGSWYSRDLTLD